MKLETIGIALIIIAATILAEAIVFYIVDLFMGGAYLGASLILGLFIFLIAALILHDK